MRRDDFTVAAGGSYADANASMGLGMHPMPADAAQMDLIFVQGFEGETIIGIDPCELDQPQTLRIDVTAGLPRSVACSTDRIGDTIHYGQIREGLRHLMQTHRLQLLEAFAEQIASMVLDEYGAHWVRVVVVKPKKFEDVEAVGVAIERRRSVARAGGSVLDWMGHGMVPS
jgi:dihydroneopterin aldolase